VGGAKDKQLLKTGHAPFSFSTRNQLPIHGNVDGMSTQNYYNSGIVI
jgi:hypothetical protein